ncbi:hypothetical protein RFI_13999 [Reticulomyxa filosa]|uniref:Uncharacterized protein n=1 Tax=Reticulomyxa filosa TaxID=46433 RepID=X6NCY4_RETFI|nr:hypothetical protein RFI_13999 [Reticulomyxa filosa]|eukprot:ETO23187.1 hypothetical protein RFI_13999 [Reticulomyxa filosa]
MKLFDLRIDPILKQMDEVLHKNERMLSEKLKYLCLVGGFNQSRYLQHKLEEHYQGKYTVLKSQRPILAVIEGATQLGRASSFITSRFVKRTYGACCGLPIMEARLNKKITEEHIHKHRFISDINNKEYVDRCFNVFVNKGDEVKVNKMVEEIYSKRNKNKKNAVILIYSSEERDPGVTTGCDFLGRLDIPYPSDFDAQKDIFYVRFYFGQSIIRVTVNMKGREYTEHEVQIKYDHGVQYVDNIFQFFNESSSHRKKQQYLQITLQASNSFLINTTAYFDTYTLLYNKKLYIKEIYALNNNNENNNVYLTITLKNPKLHINYSQKIKICK